MSILFKVVDVITKIMKWLAYGITIVMMFMISYIAISRSIGYPVKGDIELVQFVMLLLIVTSLAYTEKLNAHVTIDLIFHKLPTKIQTLLTYLAQLLVLAFCIVISWTFLVNLDANASSSVLKISFYPFRVMIVVGFIAWGLMILKKIVADLTKSNKVETS